VRARWRAATLLLVVTEAAQTLLATSLGPYLGILATGLVVFAIAPLMRAADRLAEVAMPGVKPLHELTAAERAGVYAVQARLAWADGRLSADDRRLLDRTREKLGLSHEHAARLEQEALGGSAPGL